MTFGHFDGICGKTSLPLCLVLGSVNSTSPFTRGVVPECYARSVELANTMIFQLGNAFIHFGSLVVLLIIIVNVRAKYTAIGRLEMLSFFYLMLGLVVSSLIVDCGVAPPLSTTYAYFVSLQIGFASAVCISLLFNGILCFQFWEDGSGKSIWSLRVIAVIWGAVNFILCLVTFKGWGSLTNRSTVPLFVVTYILNALLLAAYVVSQIILVIFALDTYWPLGAIVLEVFFFVVGQVITYVFSQTICNKASHYIDGLFIGSLCNLFTVMMIYKFWDMITTDDLEFSVANVEQGVQAFGGYDDDRKSLYH